ncbi:MAG: hypothetical protein ACREBS_07375 [Nitrososphaerales archaeon]
MEEEFLGIMYSSVLESYGWRQIEFLISTGEGRTMDIAHELLKRDEVAYVARTIGQFTIDLKAEMFIQSSADLINLIEEVKTLRGVKELIWSEVIEVVARKGCGTMTSVPYESTLASRFNRVYLNFF